MATENQLGGCVGDDPSDAMDRFPVGMRVLAVDDDETCRRTFDGLLRQCNYEVTTAESASEALDILRENRNKFDLVIVDVKMPEMDGFELLQHLKLEMHIPVIMVSSDADTELIKKGIEHGACDYLVKPINLEVFKTIWQHVFRRKKLNLKVQCKSSDQNQASCDVTEEGEQGISPAGASYENEKCKRKRSEQSEEDEGDRDDEHENGKPSTRKKPRLVWTAELHNKFAAVVEHLGGPETAQPKKILELMKVDGLKRANVASHLQKYRQKVQSDLSTGLRWKDSSYMSHINSLDGYGGLHSFVGLGRFSNTHGQVICSSNSAADFCTQRVSYLHLVEPGQLQNICNSTKNLANLQSDITNQSPNCFQVAHTPTDTNVQLQQSQYGRPTSYTLPSSFSCIALPVNSNHYDCNTSQLQENPQQTQGNQLFENQSSLEVASWGDLLDHSAHIVRLHGSTEGASNDLSMGEPSKQNHLYPNYSGCFETTTNDTSNIWCEEDGNHNMDHPSIVSAVAPLWPQSLDRIDGVECRSPDLSLFDHLKGENTNMEKAVENENYAIQTMMSLNEDYPLQATPLQTEANQRFFENGFESVPNPQEKKVSNESKFLNR